MSSLQHLAGYFFARQCQILQLYTQPVTHPHILRIDRTYYLAESGCHLLDQKQTVWDQNQTVRGQNQTVRDQNQTIRDAIKGEPVRFKLDTSKLQEIGKPG